MDKVPSRRLFIHFLQQAPNGLRYPLVGGTRQHHFDGTNSEPRKLLENAQTPTSRVHAVLARFMDRNVTPTLEIILLLLPGILELI